MHPALTPARQTGTRFTYLGGMEGWVDLGGWWLDTEMVCQPADKITHPSTNRARRRVTTLIKTNALLLSQATTCRLGQIHFHTLLNVPLNLDPLLTAPLRLVVLIPLPIRTHALVVFVDLQMCWISERLSRGSYGCNWGRDRGGDRDLPTLCRDETFEKYV